MYILTYLLFLNLNFTKNTKNILFIMFIYMLVNLSLLEYSYNLIFIKDCKVFYSFLYKLLAYISSIDYNVIIIILIVTLKIVFFKNYYLIYLIVLYVTTNSNCQLNVQNIITNLFWKDININFINGLFLIHPIILIYLYTCIVCYFVIKILYNNYKKFLCLRFYTNNTYIFIEYKILILNTLVLITGSWWAQQELNWGGWWSWDFVELVNLITFLLILVKNHTKNSIEYGKGYLYNYLFIFILLYSYTRYSIVPSVHNFLTDLCILQYDFYLKVLIKVLYLILVILLIKDFKFKIKVKKYFKVKNNVFLYNFIFYLVQFLTILIVLHYLLFNYNSIFIVNSIQYSILTLFFFNIILRYNFLLKYYILVLYFSIIEVLILDLISKFSKFWKKNKIQHIMFLIFIVSFILTFKMGDVLYNNLNNFLIKQKFLSYFKVDFFFKSYFKLELINFNTLNLNSYENTHLYLNINNTYSYKNSKYFLYCIDIYNVNYNYLSNNINRVVYLYIYYTYYSLMWLLLIYLFGTVINTVYLKVVFL